jgi:hypothetical protein
VIVFDETIYPPIFYLPVSLVSDEPAFAKYSKGLEIYLPIFKISF